MRLTINLDEDLYRLTRTQAFAERVSISCTVNTLLRRAIEGSRAAPAKGDSQDSLKYRGRRRFPVSEGGRPFSASDVERIESGATGSAPKPARRRP